MLLVRYSSAVVQNSPLVPVLPSCQLGVVFTIQWPAIESYQVNVVRPPPLPQPLEQAWRSTQFPASPQSDATKTDVGQKPHRLRSRSTRQSKPISAVRGSEGSPDIQMEENRVTRASRFCAANVGRLGFAVVSTAAKLCPPKKMRSKSQGDIGNITQLTRCGRIGLKTMHEKEKNGKGKSRQDEN